MRDECPKCGHLVGNIRGATESAQSRPPQPGDYIICRSCDAALRFKTADMELVELDEAPEHIQAALRPHLHTWACLAETHPNPASHGPECSALVNDDDDDGAMIVGGALTTSLSDKP